MPLRSLALRSRLLGAALLLTTSPALAGRTDFEPGPPPAIVSEALNLSDRAGRVVLVDFWASWCVPCRKSFPWLDELQARHAEAGLDVIGVGVDRSVEAAEKFLARHPVAFERYADPEGSLATALDLPAMPTSYLVDRSGTIRARHVGFRDGDGKDLEALVVELLAEPARPALSSSESKDRP